MYITSRNFAKESYFLRTRRATRAVFKRSGARFLKVQKRFQTRKVLAKFQTLWLQSCFINVFSETKRVIFTQWVSGAHTSLLLDTGHLKIFLRAWNISGAFEKTGLRSECRNGVEGWGETFCFRSRFSHASITLTALRTFRIGKRKRLFYSLILPQMLSW